MSRQVRPRCIYCGRVCAPYRRTCAAHRDLLALEAGDDADAPQLRERRRRARQLAVTLNSPLEPGRAATS